MKKIRLSTILLLVLTLLCSIFILASCGGRGGSNNGDDPTPIPPTPTKLTAPTVVLTDDTATWSADTSADKFEISMDGNLSYIENSVTSRKLTDGQTFKIRAIGDGTNYTNSDWSNSVTYVKPIPKYTITWKNGDKVLEMDTEVSEGTVPTYDGAEPTKVADSQYSYVFAGWTPEIVAANGDVTYTAVFTSVLNKYTVTWKNGDTTLETDENVAYGTMPTYNGAEPQKAADAQYVYVFSGWSPVVSEVVGNVTYVAQYTSAPNSYTIVWKNGDTTLETDENVTYGSTPSYDGATPTKDATAQYTYTFSGWTPQISSVTGSVTYQAQFTETLRSYTVTFYSEDGLTVLDTVTVEYGSNAVYSKSTPVKNATAGHTYVFENWVTTQGGSVADDLTNVIGDRSVYASFKEFVRTVTVYIVSNNTDYGTVSVSTLNNIPYGATITVNGNTVTINGQPVTANANTATAQYTYTFANWTADTTVGNDTIITANFSRSVNSYTVTWKNGDDTLETDENVAYGTTPVYNGAQPTKESDNENIYTFSGWSPAISSVTGDITYIAQFVKAESNHIVTFYDEDGSTVLAVVVVENGATACYPHAMPTKESTASVIYTFEKWVSNVNGNATADLTNITADKAVYAKYSSEARTYNVKFCDWDGSLLEEQTIEYGQSATSPQEPYREGYRFDKWNTSYNNITEDLQITATYIRQFTVKFVDYDNSIIDLQLVDYGADATKPNNPTRKNYSFIGWNTTFTNVVADLTVKAQYIRQYTVTFVDYDGTVISTDVVNSGENATPPSNPVRVGYTFTSWNQSYNNIVSDMEIMAVYEINRYTVTFLDVDGSVISSIANVAHGTTVIPPETTDMYFDWSKTKGYRFTGWKDWSASQPIVGNITITAEYSEEITDPIIAIETKEISKGTTTAEVSVYLCGSFENIYGMSLKLQYAEELVLSNGSVIINSKLVGSESTLNTENSLYELSWADGQGIDVSERLEVLTLTFSVDKYTNVGEYIMELLDGTYIIGENLSKITPIVIVGHVVITE